MNGMLLADLWTHIIDLFAKWIVNYGWAIVVFTVVLKLVLTPLDIMQRVATQKQSRVTAYMQPELDAIKKKYGDNKERINAETQKKIQHWHGWNLLDYVVVVCCYSSGVLHLVWQHTQLRHKQVI